MSMRETIVPKSFDIQRTNAKMLPGANDRTRLRRSRIRLLGNATEANSVLDALLKPEQLDFREIAHAALLGVLHRRSSAVHACKAGGLRRGLCTARKTARSVRRNPKDFWLVKLRAAGTR